MAKAATRPSQPRLGFQSVDILKIFICIFKPWEVEEIACIYTFAKEKYDQIFRDIRWDVHEGKPKFEGQRPPTPEGTFDLDNSCQFCPPFSRHDASAVSLCRLNATKHTSMRQTRVRESLLKGTISRGLELLPTILFKIRDHTHLV